MSETTPSFTYINSPCPLYLVMNSPDDVISLATYDIIRHFKWRRPSTIVDFRRHFVTTTSWSTTLEDISWLLHEVLVPHLGDWYYVCLEISALALCNQVIFALLMEGHHGTVDICHWLTHCGKRWSFSMVSCWMSSRWVLLYNSWSPVVSLLLAMR